MFVHEKKMLNYGIVLGQYLPFSSIIHKLDPRTKILLLAGWCIGIFFLNHPLSYGALLFFILILFFISKISFLHVIKGLQPILLLLFFTLFLNLFFIPGDSLLKLGPLIITREGVTQSFMMAGRMLSLFMFTLILLSTTSALEITSALELLLRPLSKLGFPVYEFSLMMTIALQFIPVFFEELQRIINAQQSRGANFHDKNLSKRIKLLLPVCIPLFNSAFRKAHELGMAMEARGYMPGMPRTRYRLMQFAFRDFVAFLVSVYLFFLIK